MTAPIAMDVDGQLARLKDFQRATVEHVFRRMYLDEPPTHRFLVADEVGLGKTMVARGVIARVIDHLATRPDPVERIDVIYVCSNAAIAAQNLRRLDVLSGSRSDDRPPTFATRLTLLPLQVGELDNNRVNFISFTPGTTFDLRSSTGTVEERALLCTMLWPLVVDLRLGISPAGFRRMMRVGAGPTRWDEELRRLSEPDGPRIHAQLAARFRAAVREDAAAYGSPLSELESLSHAWFPAAGLGEDAAVGHDPLGRRNRLIGHLRRMLATICLDALEPDLVIMDEFQRFKHLMAAPDDEGARSEEAELAHALFDYTPKNGDPPPRVLLLSATPYKAYTLHAEQEEDDHHDDFMRTLGFLFGGGEPAREAVAQVREALQDHRAAIDAAGETIARAVGSGGATPLDDAVHRPVQDAAARVRAQLLQVMVRTERTAHTAFADAMLREELRTTDLALADVQHAVAIERLAAAMGERSQLSYWKSAPYLLSFMRGYRFDRRLKELEDGPLTPAVAEALRQAVGAASVGLSGANDPDSGDGADSTADTDSGDSGGVSALLDEASIQRYEPLDPSNPRLRRLVDDMLEGGLWRVLWLPPSLRYLRPSGPFVGLGRAGPNGQREKPSKALLFSAWNVAPDAIAAVASYLAERRMVRPSDDEPVESSYATYFRQRRPLLRFAVREVDGRTVYAGMGALLLQYPSPALARLVDPLALARDDGGPLDADDAVRAAASRIGGALRSHGVFEGVPRDGRSDERWLWIAVALLDRAMAPEVQRWLRHPAPSGPKATRERDLRFEALHPAGRGGSASTEASSAFAAVLQRFRSLLEQGLDAPELRDSPLGRPPEDLAWTLARVALASPGVCALRALRRQRPETPWTEPRMLFGAANIAEGFRTLFNVPESIALLTSDASAASAGAPQGTGREHHAHEDEYWQRCLQHGLDGDLQSLLDEQVHVLRESLGFFDEAVDEPSFFPAVADELAEALSLRTATLHPARMRVGTDAAGRPTLVREQGLALRTRFALRLGDLRDEQGGQLARLDTVRKAFNSPFRPFVLASTSIGQEGLDFHVWCRLLYHWNLPHNPVDLEQREGRVHRYKGLAVRQNIAVTHGDDALGSNAPDPWAAMFAAARAQAAARGQDELVPYWLFDVPAKDGGVAVERRVPLPPLSKEAARFAALRRSLVLYRLAFGQPRQEDLVAYLRERLRVDEATLRGIVGRWRVSLGVGSGPRFTGVEHRPTTDPHAHGSHTQPGVGP